MVVYLLMIESFEQVPIEARRLLFTFISGRPAPRWERHVQLWRRGRAWVSDGRVVGKERRRSVPTALVVPSTYHHGAGSARVCQCVLHVPNI